jgi:hypothetical protein
LMWWLWQEVHRQRSLWDACQALASRPPPSALSISGRVDPHRLLSDLLRGLHMLLSIQVIYLDVPRGSEDPRP